MRKSTKNLILIGLVFYGVGIIQNIWNTFVEIHTAYPFNFIDALKDTKTSEYVIHTLVLTGVSVLIRLLISAVLGLFTYSFFKNSERNKAIRLSIASGAILLFDLVFTILSFTPAIPQYLIYSKLGIIDTYITYLIPIFEGGAFFMFIGVLLIFIGTMIQILSKRHPNNEKQ